MSTVNCVVLWVLNYVYMYADMKGAFVQVWGEMGLLREHVKVLLAHVKLLHAHVKWLRAHVKHLQILFSPCPLRGSVS